MGELAPASIIRLDWDRLALPQVAEWLLRAQAPGGAEGVIDLSDSLVVLPGARAGRVLLWHLAVRARTLGVRLVPPQVVTPGAMVEVLADAGGAEGTAASASGRSTPAVIPGEGAARLRPAGELARLCAVMQALERTSPATIEAIAPRGGARRAGTEALDLPRRLAMARMLVSVQDELGGAGRSLPEAAEAMRALASAVLSQREQARWESLDAVAKAAGVSLAASGFADPMSLRWQMAQSSPPRHPSLRQLVLALVVELNLLQRTLIGRFAAAGGAVAALVHAPAPEDASGCPFTLDDFDQLGCLRSDDSRASTASQRPCIADGDLTVVEQASDVPQVAMEFLEQVDGRTTGQVEALGDAAVDPAVDWNSAEDVRSGESRSPSAASSSTIGLLDPSLDLLLQQAARFSGFAVRSAAGRSMSETETWRTIDGLASWMDRPSGLLALARLPAAGRWLRQALLASGSSRLDRSDDLVRALERASRALRPGARTGPAGLDIEGQRLLDALAASLRGAPQPLPAWSSVLRGILAELLASLEPDPIERDAVALLVEELGAWSELPQDLAPILPGRTALGLLATRLAATRLPAPVRRGEIDALGWLELHADDSPNLLLLGLHEGCVPSGGSNDPLLPEALRIALGLPDDAHAARRDAYLLAAMQRGRSRFGVVAARRGIEGDPVLASRLLLDVPRPELPGRVRRIAGHGARRFAQPRGLPPASPVSRFVVPSAPTTPVDLRRIRVTECRDYLQCPYRYWLRHRLKLEAWKEPGEQLDAAEFGTLAHGVLQRWGSDLEARELQRSDGLALFLNEALEDQISVCYPDGLPVAVAVQMSRLRERLQWFAEAQAAHRRDGWRVEHVEWSLPEDAHLEVPDEPSIQVVGRVDRIDRHEDGRFLLLDYKTADKATTPEKHHGSKTEDGGMDWRDLQLPLYGVLAAPALGMGEWRSDQPALAVGYMNIAATAASTGLAVANWTPEQIESAVGTAQWVVSMIRKGRFQMKPDAGRRLGGSDDFARICQNRALGRFRGEADDEEEQPDA